MLAARPSLVLARSLSLAGGLVALAALSACAPEPPPKFEFTVRVTSDPGKPLKGAELKSNGKTLGTTGNEGGVKVSLTGREGETIDLTVSCPDGYASPTKPITITLRKVSDESSKRPEYPVSCPPTTRSVVIAVRADNAPNMPVMYLGQVRARTDAAGAAHFVVPGAPDDLLEITLDTSSDDKILPRNPTTRINVRPYDDIYVFEPKLTLKKEKAKPHYSKPVRTGPQKI